MNTEKYRGAGLNAASMLAAVRGANDSPSQKTLPAGATWPLVTLSIGDNSIEFDMLSVHKSVSVQDVVKVELSKYGYIFFHTQDKANDFGFCTMRLDSLVAQLEEKGYTLANTVNKNRTIAKISLFLIATVSLGVIALVTIMSVLKPHGV